MIFLPCKGRVGVDCPRQSKIALGERSTRLWTARGAVEGYQRPRFPSEADTPPPRRFAPRSPSPSGGGFSR